MNSGTLGYPSFLNRTAVDASIKTNVILQHIQILLSTLTSNYKVNSYVHH